MSSSVSEVRASASRVAKFLAARGRAPEAVALLSAWAVAENDVEGHNLLAEALQLDGRAEIAKMAFERMEGIQGAHGPLEEAIARYSAEEVAKLEKELTRPAFRRAQLGHNNEIKYKGRVFHVQTEDSGLDKPHVITHLFADGGRIIRSVKRTYATHVDDADVAKFVKALMKGQHMEMVLFLRDGHVDGILEGREPGGGMSVLEHPPNVEIQKVGSKPKASEPPAPAAPPPARETPVPPSTRFRFRLQVVRSLSGGPDVYDAAGDEIVIGSSGQVALAGEKFCHPSEARIRCEDSRLFLEDLDGGNGVFLRIRAPVELGIGDEFIIGDQLLRITKPPTFDHTPGPGPTYCYSSPVREASFRVIQIFEGGREGGCVLARGTTLYIGSAYNDMIIRGDALVSEHHCLLDEQAGTILLTDLGSRTGVFVRIQGHQELRHGDELMIGRTRLEVDLSQGS